MRLRAYNPLVVPGNSVVSACGQYLRRTPIGCFAVRFEIRFAGCSPSGIGRRSCVIRHSHRGVDLSPEDCSEVA